MQPKRTTICLIGVAFLFGLGGAHAQISHVTVRTVKSPGPPMVLVSTNPAPVTAIQPALPQVQLIRPIPRPSLDKSELDRRVVAFQTKRAEEGSASAQYELGLRYIKGDGVEKNVSKAQRWLKAAAAGGNTQAVRKLAEMASRSP